MLKALFLSKGRIRRSQYIPIYSLIMIGMIIIRAMLESGIVMAVFIQIPLLWIYFAQGARRAHDRGSSGWMQLIPFYNFYLLFADSLPGHNMYGDNPKGINTVESSIEQINFDSEKTVHNPVNQGESFKQNLYKKKDQNRVKTTTTTTTTSKQEVKRKPIVYQERKIKDETIKSRVLKAIRERKDIIISYKKFNGEHSKRRISNVELSNDFTDRGYNNAHIKGYCHLRNEERTFRISRINKLEIA